MHSLYEAAELLGIKDPRHLHRCMQYAGISPPRDERDKRRWRFTDAEIARLRDAYAELYGPKQQRDDLEQRLAAVEDQLARLRQRASWLFEDAPSAQSVNPTHGEARQPVAPAYPARLHTASRTRPLSLARLHGGAPDGWKTLEEMCERHEVGVTTAKVAGKDGRLSVRYETYVHPTAANARVSHWLDEAGQRQFHTAFQRTFRSPCECCGLDWRAEPDADLPTHDEAP